MGDNPSYRYDKYLWAVRLFKSRSLASDACKTGKVELNGHTLKPSRTVETGDMISVRRAPARFTYRVKGIPPSRVSAKLVENYLEDLTPEEEKIKLSAKAGIVHAKRPRGMGRPTKKERRDIDRLSDSSF